MGAGHDHRRRAWGEPPPRLIDRLRRVVRSVIGDSAVRDAPGELPLALRRTEPGRAYLATVRAGEHPASAEAAAAAMERAVGDGDWWAADVWGHRALWHYEQAALALQAVRQARRIGDVRSGAGDPSSARRYYAEAIDEARDIGAEREQGLAAIGLGRALLELGEVTQARRLAAAAVDLLQRSDAPIPELAAARELLGTEVAVGAGTEKES
jgi:tetratricopeptide (TPR) repeat protein